MKKHYIALAILILLTTSNQAQNNFSGVVFGINNGSRYYITGANVIWAGTFKGTTTDENGQFVLPSTNESSRLVVSFVGFETDTIKVSNETRTLEIELTPNKHLDEVTVLAREPGAHISRINPVTVIQITSAELFKAPCCTLAESFETNASVEVTFTDAATGAKRIQLLGLSGTYVQMLTENMHMGRGLSSVYGLDFIPGPWLEGIQISKGAALVTHGYESLTGQINAQYKRPSTSEALFVNGFAGSGGRFEANVNTGFNVGERWQSAILTHSATVSNKIDHKNDGFLDEPLIIRNTIMNRWEFRPNQNIFSQFGAKILQEERVGGQTTFNERLSPFDQNAYGIVVDSRNLETFFKTGYIFPNNENKSAAIVTNFTWHDHQSIYGRRFYDATQNLFVGNLMFSSYINNPERHTYTTGISFKYDKLAEQFWGNTDNDNVPSGNRTEQVTGIYFQYTGNFTDQVTLLAGIRGDYHNMFGFITTPRVHLRYTPFNNLIVRASAGKGYRTPNPLAENNPILASSRRVIIHDGITLERGLNYGINVTNYLTLANRELTLNLEYYRTEFRDQLILDLDRSPGEAHFYNLNGKSFSNVWQAEASMQVARNFDVIAAMRINDVKVTTNGILQPKALQSRYRGLFNLSYATPLLRWQFDFTTQFNGPGRVPATTLPHHGNEQLDTRFSSFQIHNFQVTRFIGNWSLYAGVENIGNFTQHNPVIGAESPFGENFDSSLVWGPLMGRKFYFGFRFALDRQQS